MSEKFKESVETADVESHEATSGSVLATSAPRNRRRFLAQAGMLGLGALGATQIAANAQLYNKPFPAKNPFPDPFANPRRRITDVDILNFALNLEYLEAEFYLRAAFGSGLSDSDINGVGTLGPVSGGRQVPFETDAIRQYAEEIALDELAHVRLLRSVLGSRRVARPALNLDTSFTLAARAAGVVGPNDTFDPYADENSFLLGAFIFEDVGVTAYKGAAPLIQDKGILEAAAGLLAVEAYHAGEIRTVLFNRGQELPQLLQAANAISDLRDAVDGPTDLDQGITDENGRANIVPTDANGLAFSRTPAQVLNIVYLGGSANGFGFFPNRLNGRIR